MKRNDRFFPSVWDGFFDSNWSGLPAFAETSSHVPAVNIRESDDGFEIEMAVPGLKKEDFKVDLDHNLLTISAEKKSEKSDTDDGGKYTRKEFSYRSFKRTFTLPDTTNDQGINAKYEDGVLYVSIPKKEEAKPQPPKMIEVA